MGEPAAGPHATVDAVGRDAGDAGGARPAARGLTTAEVAERVAAGRINEVPSAPSRTVGQILRANVATPVNAVIGVLLVAILVARGGPSADMLFAGVIVANSVIGTVQELRARAALDRLAVLQQRHRASPCGTGPRWSSTVERSGGRTTCSCWAPAPRSWWTARSSTAAASSSTSRCSPGRRTPWHKGPGDEVLSGSFVVAGTGRCRATRVGADAYAAARSPRRPAGSRLVDSELRRGINRILKVLMLLIPPVAALLFWRLLEVSDDWQRRTGRGGGRLGGHGARRPGAADQPGLHGRSHHARPAPAPCCASWPRWSCWPAWTRSAWTRPAPSPPGRSTWPRSCRCPPHGTGRRDTGRGDTGRGRIRRT